MRTLLLILFSTVILYSQDPQWNVIGEMNNPVAGAQIAVFDSLIYIIGGYSGDLQQKVNWIQKFSPVSERATLAGNIPNARSGFAGAQNDSVFYFTGGEVATDTSSIDSWNVLENNSAIIKGFTQFDRSFPSAEIVNGKFYLIGGDKTIDSTVINNYLIEYSLTDSIITNEYIHVYGTDILPYQQMTCVIGTDIYILGGARNGILKDIYRFNTVDTSYTKLDIELPIPIAGAASVSVPSKNATYLIGGFNETNLSLSSVYIFRDAGFEYTMFEIVEAAPLNYSRSLSQAAFLDNKIYVFGGYDENHDVVPQIEMLDLSEVVSSTTETYDRINFNLDQNYPNPFNPGTSITFSVGNRSKVNISVYSILGEKIFDFGSKNYESGTYTVYMDAADLNLSSGVYIYQMKAGDFIKTRKMMYIK